MILLIASYGAIRDQKNLVIKTRPTVYIYIHGNRVFTTTGSVSYRMLRWGGLVLAGGHAYCD